MVFALVGVDKRTERVEQTVEWVCFVRARLRQRALASDCRMVFFFGTQEENVVRWGQ